MLEYMKYTILFCDEIEKIAKIEWLKNQVNNKKYIIILEYISFYLL